MINTAARSAQDRLLAAGLAFEGDFKGCTEEEIRSIEDRFGIHLPLSYRDFLSVMGRRAGDFLVGSDYSFPEMFAFRKEAEELLEKCQPAFHLSATSFVFFAHQGYNFQWFDCKDEAVDPCVVLFTEPEEPRKVAESFSAWLLGVVEDDIAAYRELRDS